MIKFTTDVERGHALVFAAQVAQKWPKEFLSYLLDPSVLLDEMDALKDASAWALINELETRGFDPSLVSAARDVQNVASNP